MKTMSSLRGDVWELMLDGQERTAQEVADALGKALAPVSKILRNMLQAGDLEYRNHAVELHHTGFPVRIYRVREVQVLPTADEVIQSAMRSRHPLEQVWGAR